MTEIGGITISFKQGQFENYRYISSGKIKIMPDILTIGSGGASEGLAAVLTQAIALSGMKIDSDRKTDIK